MTKPNTSTPSKSTNRKLGLIVGLFIALCLLAMVAWAVYVFVIQKAPAGSDLIARRFLTDKIQADTKADVVIFSNSSIDQPGFMQEVEDAKQVARNGGYYGEPELVRPARGTTSLRKESIYKICTSESQNCLYFWIETVSRNQGPRTRSAREVVSFSVHKTEAEAVARYDD